MTAGAPNRPRCVGLIGFGFIGQRVYESITSNPSQGLEVAFVHNRSGARLAAVPAALQLHDLDALAFQA